MSIKDYCYYAMKLMNEKNTKELIYCCAPASKLKFCNLEKCPKKEEYIQMVGIENYK